MIVLPKSLCQPCEPIVDAVRLSSIPPIKSCPPCEPANNIVILKPIVNELCLCPAQPEPVVVPTKKYVKISTVDLCYRDFVLAVSTTKFCKIGPKCRSNS